MRFKYFRAFHKLLEICQNVAQKVAPKKVLSYSLGKWKKTKANLQWDHFPKNSFGLDMWWKFYTWFQLLELYFSHHYAIETRRAWISLFIHLVHRRPLIYTSLMFIHIPVYTSLNKCAFRVCTRNSLLSNVCENRAIINKKRSLSRVLHCDKTRWSFRTRGKCRKHEPQASVFYISRVFSNDRSVLSQCNTRLRLLHLL